MSVSQRKFHLWNEPYDLVGNYEVGRCPLSTTYRIRKIGDTEIRAVERVDLLCEVYDAQNIPRPEQQK